MHGRRGRPDQFITNKKGQGLINERIQGTWFRGPAKGGAGSQENILNKFRSQPGPDDPAVKARQAEREALAAERANANLAREAAKAERKRLEEEVAAKAAAELLREKEKVVARQVALEAEQKIARDARYAARKKKKR